MSVAAIAAMTALVACGITVGLIAILHVLEPEYDPSWRMISEYSLGRHGWVMRLAFVTMAIGSRRRMSPCGRSVARGPSPWPPSHWARSVPRSSTPIRS
ncbi:DUF998 domain-containing protein [Agromyces sp. MMS24-JH15]|uniref:DUF998 domain-containing protein n=1 Tax=Agromyces sp. MMS24-JH15 TaxID=3243765 RepID=UPI003747955A